MIFTIESSLNGVLVLTDRSCVAARNAVIWRVHVEERLMMRQFPN